MIENLPDQKIVSAIREGNTAAFQQVFDTCYDGLCHYAFTILKNSDEAEDIVQTMFMKLWEKRESLDIQHTVKSYLYRAVYNQCMNHLEHRAVRNKYANQEGAWLDGTQGPEVFVDELYDRIKKVVEVLPPQCRTIFIMSRYEELRYSEIAEKLNISVNTIQNQVCKALRILREELKDFT